METLKTTGYAPVNGLQMYYEIHGEGTIPLVLIHGGGSTIDTSFGNSLPLFASHGKVIAVELQAHGRTTDRDAPESFQQDADDVAGLMNYLGIEKASFLGFSNGGSTTLQIAIRHPQLVNKIVVISGAYRRDGFIPGFFDGVENATIANLPPALKAAFLAVTPDETRLQNMFDKDVQRMATFKDWPDADIQSIKAPALIMVADHDVVTPEHTIQITRLIAGARLAILPATHGSIIGEVGSIKNNSKLHELTVALVTEFLAE